MDFVETIRQLEAAQKDPEALTFATLNIVLAPRPAELRRTLEAAAIPHWFDDQILGALSDGRRGGELSVATTEVYQLPMVEPFVARNASNVHEATRLVIRKVMARDNPERFRELSRRAAEYFAADVRPHARIEEVYHRLAYAPDDGANRLLELHETWRFRGAYEPLQALAIMLEEHCRAGLLASRTRALVVAILAQLRQHHMPLATTVRLWREAIELFKENGNENNEAVALDYLGEHLRAEGQLDAALAEYEAALAIRQRLVAEDPENTEQQLQLSNSFNGIGEILRSRGQLDAALAQYEGAMEIRERLAAEHAEDAEYRRDLSVSYNNVGRILRAHGSMDDALVRYQDSLSIRAKLVAQDPHHTEWQRDLSISHNDAGDALHEAGAGRYDDALAHYNAALEILTKLAAGDPTNTEWQRDLSISHNKLGRLLYDCAEFDGALEHYLTSLAILQKLTDQDRHHTEWQRDLSISHNNVGDALQSMGRLEDASKHYGTSVAILRKLTNQHRNNTEWQGDLVRSLTKVGRLQREMKRCAEAYAHLKDALELAERLAAAEPSRGELQRAVMILRSDVVQAASDLAKLEHSGV